MVVLFGGQLWHASNQNHKIIMMNDAMSVCVRVRSSNAIALSRVHSIQLLFPSVVCRS